MAEVVTFCRQSQVCSVQHANCRTILPLNNSAPGQGCAARSISVLGSSEENEVFPYSVPCAMLSWSRGNVFS